MGKSGVAGSAVRKPVASPLSNNSRYSTMYMLHVHVTCTCTPFHRASQVLMVKREDLDHLESKDSWEYPDHRGQRESKERV